MLNWNLNDIRSELATISHQGFDAIQINPIQPLKEEGFQHWWLSYQPCGFQIGNQYGSKDDLKALCFYAEQYGIRIIADVICNHMAEAGDGQLMPHEKVDPLLRNNSTMWKEARNISDWNSRYEITNYCFGLPGLEPHNKELQTMVIHFLNELIDCGVSGFRFDAAKHIPLPHEGCDFWNHVLSNLKNPELFNYGEVIFANHELINEYGKYMKVLTNTFGGYKDVDQIIAFSENHDSYLEFAYTRMKTGEQINNEYRWLTGNYENTIYYVRPYDESWKKELVREANLCRGNTMYPVRRKIS